MRLFALPRRIWKSLHPFTWLVMLVVGVGLVIIVVPGEVYPAWDLNQAKTSPWARGAIAASSHADLYCEHGWPLTFALRSVHSPPTGSYYHIPASMPTGSYYQVPSAAPIGCYWTKPMSWPFQADEWAVNWLNLSIDTMVAVLLLVGISGSLEFWIRRRGGLVRFRVIDLLAALTIGAFALGWYQYHVSLHRTELAISESLSHSVTLGGTRFRARQSDYTGPDWLRRLVGNDGNLAILHHVTSVWLRIDPEGMHDPDQGTGSWQEDIDEICRLRYVEQVEIEGLFPLEAIEKLRRLPRLKSLVIRSMDETCRPWTGELLGLEPHVGYLYPEDLVLLRALQLQRLELCGNQVLAEDVDRLLDEMPKLKELTLIHASLTLDELVELRAEHPQVEILADLPFPVLGNSLAETSPSEHDASVAEAKRQRTERLKEEFSAR